MIKLKKKNFKVIDDKMYYKSAKKIIKRNGQCSGISCKICPLNNSNLIISIKDNENIYMDNHLNQTQVAFKHMKTFIKLYKKIQKEKDSNIQDNTSI